MTGHSRDMAMPKELKPKTDPGEPMVYQIRIKGHLGSQWTDWFDGLAITPQANGDTLLTGPVIDQAALHGLLRKVRDIGTPLLSVICVSPGQANRTELINIIQNKEHKNDGCQRKNKSQ